MWGLPHRAEPREGATRSGGSAMKLPTREQLEKRRTIVIADAQSKLEAEDWHGCADAMMDLREIDAMLTVLR